MIAAKSQIICYDAVTAVTEHFCQNAVLLPSWGLARVTGKDSGTVARADPQGLADLRGAKKRPSERSISDETSRAGRRPQ